MGSPCPTNLTEFTDSTLTTQTKEKAVHISELKAAINREREPGEVTLFILQIQELLRKFQPVILTRLLLVSIVCRV